MNGQIKKVVTKYVKAIEMIINDKGKKNDKTTGIGLPMVKQI